MASSLRSNTLSPSDQVAPPAVVIWQRRLLVACIILAPISITLYLITWTGNGRQPLVASAMASPTANTLHLIGAVAASFFLPLGYLGMSLLGTRRAPVLATVCAALSLIGWIPWAALIVLDDAAVAIHQMDSTAQLDALWAHVNSDTSCLPSC